MDNSKQASFNSILNQCRTEFKSRNDLPQQIPPSQYENLVEIILQKTSSQVFER